ncbi:ion channel [Anaeromicrobium sediminis]|nr:ion channel [Anaeromicrobium sediminis]
MEIILEKILEEPFRRGINKTAIVTIIKKHSTIKSERYGYLTANQVYDMIDEGAAIHLSKVYVKDFSLDEYRATRKLAKYANVKLKWCNFEECVFDISDSNYISFNNADFGNFSVNFSKATFGKGDVYFSGAIFGGGYINFKQAYFSKGNINFDNINFGTGDINFDATHFGDGHVYFNDTNFGEGNINFLCATFGKGNVDFFDCTFGKGNVDFYYTIFDEGGIYFGGATFNKSNLNFAEATFSGGDVFFDCATFNEGSLSFDEVIFGESNVDFNDMSLNELLFDKCNFKTDINIKKLKCKELYVKDCIIKEIFDLSNMSKEKINTLSFNNTKNLGQIFLCWDDNIRSAIVGVENSEKYISKSYTCKLLKENYHNIGEYNNEDYAYVEFRRCQRKSLYYRENINKPKKNNKIFSKEGITYMWEYLKYTLMPLRSRVDYIIGELIGGYGTKPRNVFCSCIITICIFAFIYNILPSGSELSDLFKEKPSEVKLFIESANGKTPISVKYAENILLMDKSTSNNLWASRLWSGIYFSGITFLTIGYGDIAPKDTLTAIFCVLEGFCGIFLMSYFTVAFVRKILR